MAGPRGYSSYRGRIPKGKILLAVILSLIILAAVIFLWVQRKLVYDDSGTPHLPSVAEEPSGQTPDVDLIIEPAQIAESLRAVQLPQTPLADWDWQGVINPYRESGENNALAVTMKASGGRVYYDFSANDLTGQSVPAVTMEDVNTLTGKTNGKRTIARLSCLRDSIAARRDAEDMGLKNTGGFVFYDGNNESWLDPAKEKTVGYLAALVRECAEAGFDEILLTDVGYPTMGKLDKIDYGALPEGGRPAVIGGFLTAMRDALAEYPGVTLSVELPAAVISNGHDEAAGLVLAELSGLADRIYAVTTTADAAALANAVAAVGDIPFVPELTAAPAEGSFLLLS